MQILKASTSHQLRLDGRLFDVPLPTTRHVLSMLFLSSELSEEEPELLTEFLEIVEDWLPKAVYRRLYPRGIWRLIYGRMPIGWSVQIATRLATLGAPDNEEAHDPDTGEALDPDEAMRRFLACPWEIHVAEVAAQLSITPQAVLEMPWQLFNLMLRSCDAMRARYQLDYLTAKGLPHIEEDRERDKAFDKLQKRAGYHIPERDKSPEEKRAEQRKAWEAVRRMMTSTS